ncbi:MAG: helix-turn-helix domain-containing protein [Pseudomonadales bacterium]|jgi:predicted XRE-type DNA-binding protein|nr:helix-turn-helix domain-containing protein [Pseudomonadales bacterium]
MIHQPQHTITSANPIGGAKLELALTFADGFAATVKLKDWSRRKALAALSDPAVFAAARVDAHGGYVVFIEDDLELAADNLRNLAIEQSGGIGHERMWNWMHANNLTQERAAAAIGISRRMLNYYLSGAKAIPLTVWLACVGWQYQRQQEMVA